MQEIFPDHFVLFKPKDVVSGDFYWVQRKENMVFVAVADCTGHGVPGAFMSMIGNTLLDHIIRIKRVFNPALALEHLHTEIKRVLRQDESQDRNGMDMALCVFKKMPTNQVQLTFAGAKRSLYYTSPKPSQVQELRGSSKSIGGLQPSAYCFANQQLIFTQNDLIYLSSDGYCDQNNQARRILGKVKYQQLLQNNHRQPMAQQKKILEDTLHQHMQGTYLRDDILVLGLKLNIAWDSLSQ